MQVNGFPSHASDSQLIFSFLLVYAWVDDDPCGDGDLPPWSGVTCSTVGDYRVVTEL